jgi:hypothetical protein
MPEPSKEKLYHIGDEFNKRANFPNCIGALDGKHIRTMKPEHSESLYYNYKHFLSIALLALSDADYCFIAVDIGAFGKSSDSSVFKNSTLWAKLNSNKLHIPDPVELRGTDRPKLPHVIVADELFGLTHHIMRPYGGNNLTMKKRIFNYRLCRARRYVECSFGILTNKWNKHRSLNVSLEFAKDIVKAFAILHNFVRVTDGFRFEDTLNIEGLEDLQCNTNNSPRGPNAIRDTFVDYFQSAGEFPYQYTKT